LFEPNLLASLRIVGSGVMIRPLIKRGLGNRNRPVRAKVVDLSGASTMPEMDARPTVTIA
jgi:hypothetical protein